MVEEQEEEDTQMLGKGGQNPPVVKMAFEVSPIQTPMNQSQVFFARTPSGAAPVLPFSGNSSIEVTSVQPFKQTQLISRAGITSNE
jgi:hypothetical protein